MRCNMTLLGHVMSLVLGLASCEADGITNGTVTLLRSG